MKNNIKVALFALVLINGLALNIYGQDTKPINMSGNILVGITGGISSVLGNYTKTDFADNTSGFARSGTNIGITGIWFIKKNFGITALISYHQYGFRGIQNIADGFHEAFDVDSASATTKGSNYTFNILVGPNYIIPVSNKFSIDFRGLAGLTNASLAGWEVVLTDAHITHPALSQNDSKAIAFGMQAGIGLHYNIASNWAVFLNFDYFYSKPNFTITNLDRNVNAGREITSYRQAIDGINANFTIVYLLKHK